MSQYGDINVMVNWCTRQKVGNVWQNSVILLMEACQDVIGFGPEGWVPAEYYEEAMVISKKLKKDGLAAVESEEERAQIAAHWPLDDMEEEEYM
jgi:hypothetical protein